MNNRLKRLRINIIEKKPLFCIFVVTVVNKFLKAIYIATIICERLQILQPFIGEYNNILLFNIITVYL